MLRMIPKTFAWTFSVMDGGESVAQVVNRSWWSDKGEFRAHGVDYTARREGVVSGAFVLKSTAGVIARATKPSVWRRSLIVEHSGRQYTIRAASAFRRKFVVLDGATGIGSLSPEGLFTRRAVVDLPPTLPLAVRVFMIWLIAMLWKHNDGAGS